VEKQLSQITIRGYKSIRELNSFKMKNLNILIGANGAGKSNFIQMFSFLHNILALNLQNHVIKNGGSETFLYHGSKTTDSISLQFEFGQNSYECTLEPTSDQSLFFSSEKICYHDYNYPSPCCTTIGSGHRESALQTDYSKSQYRRMSDYVINAIKSWKLYHFHDSGFTAKVKGLADINDNGFLRPDASNLASYLYYLKNSHKSHYDNITDLISQVAPFFDDFNLRPVPGNENQIRLEWSEKGSDSYYNAHSFSDGTLRFICLAVLLMQPEDKFPSVILLDEPELGLHPYAISVLADMIRFAALKTQVIISTQSVTLVNHFEPDDLIIVNREDGQSVFRRPPREMMEEWLENYALGDLWEKNLMGGRP